MTDLDPLVTHATGLAWRLRDQDPADPRCGTYAGVMAHRHAHTALCTACGQANAAYARDWRRRHPGANAAYCRTSRERRRCRR